MTSLNTCFVVVAMVFLIMGFCYVEAACPDEAFGKLCEFTYSGVYSWGAQANGELGTGEVSASHEFLPSVPFPKKLKIVAASFHMLISDNGDAYVLRNKTLWDKIETNLRFMSVFQNFMSDMLLLTVDGKIYAFDFYSGRYRLTEIVIENVDGDIITERVLHISNSVFVNKDGLYVFKLQPDKTMEDYMLCLPATLLGSSQIIQIGFTYRGIDAYSDEGVIAALLSNGTLIMWGRNTGYQLGPNAIENEFYDILNQDFVQVSLPYKIDSFAIESQYTAAIANGDVYVWGTLFDTFSTSTPQKIFVQNVKFSRVIPCSDYITLVSTDGQVYSFGANTVGQLGDGTLQNRKVPVRNLKVPNGSTLSATSGSALLFVYDSEFLLWNFETAPEIPRVSDWRSVDAQNMKSQNVQSIVSGTQVTFLLSQSGAIFATGANNGMIGDGSTTRSTIPVPVYMQGVMKNVKVKSLEVFQEVVFAIGEKQLYAWGAYAPCIHDGAAPLVPVEYSLAAKVTTVLADRLLLAENGLLYSCSSKKQHEPANLTKLAGVRFPNASKLPQDTISATFVLFSSDGRVWILSQHLHYFMKKNIFQDCQVENTYPIICRMITPWSTLEISRVTLWFMEDEYKLLVILKNGNVFRWDNYWQNYTSGVDPLLTTENLLVFTNGSMLAYYQTSWPRITRIQMITPPITTNMKKIIVAARTSYGVMAVFAKCTSNYTGPTCSQPVCKEIAPYGVCSGHGTCIAPQTCECHMLWEGKFCEVMSASAIAIITVCSIVGGTLAIIFIVLVAVFTTIHCGRVVRQKQVETEMKELLHQSLIRGDALAEQVDRDWVIPFVDLVFDERISEGSFGIVMRGRYQKGSVAIKIIKDFDDNNMTEFEQEDETRFIVTELMTGGSLEKLVHSKKKKQKLHESLKFSRKIDLLLDVVKGLLYLHGLNPVIVHRDLKPGNILLDKHQQVAKVCDFGTATYVANRTMTGNVGTILYMAPELLTNTVQHGQSTKVDVYSFGIIMYELFFETIPYRENEEKFESIVGLGTRVVGGLRPTLANFSQSGLSEAENLYLELMQECWSGDPEARPSFDQIFTKFMDITNLLI